MHVVSMLDHRRRRWPNIETTWPNVSCLPSKLRGDFPGRYGLALGSAFGADFAGRIHDGWPALSAMWALIEWDYCLTCGGFVGARQERPGSPRPT